MTYKNREHRRIDKPLNILFCIADANPKKWDMSVIKNISAGGVMFVSSSDMKLKDKIVQLQIKIPELAPRYIELEATVLDVKPCFNPKISEVRAKFINVSEESKEQLTIVEKIIQVQEAKAASNIKWK